jgi:hypothetical protein
MGTIRGGREGKVTRRAVHRVEVAHERVPEEGIKVGLARYRRTGDGRHTRSNIVAVVVRLRCDVRQVQRVDHVAQPSKYMSEYSG